MELVNYCNDNQGFMSAVLALFAVIVSIIAIWISISTTKKQNKIALFEKRYQAYYMMSIFLTNIRHYRDSKDSCNHIIKRLYFLLVGNEISHIQKSDKKNTDTQVILYFAMYFDKIDLLFGKEIKREYDKVKDTINKYINSLLYYSGGLEELDSTLSEKTAKESLSEFENLCTILANKLSI